MYVHLYLSMYLRELIHVFSIQRICIFSSIMPMYLLPHLSTARFITANLCGGVLYEYMSKAKGVFTKESLFMQLILY